jgi:hypothetical protein
MLAESLIIHEHIEELEPARILRMLHAVEAENAAFFRRFPRHPVDRRLELVHGIRTHADSGYNNVALDRGYVNHGWSPREVGK